MKAKSCQDSMSDDNTLRPGVNVDIRRSDGRIHSAVVSKINWDTRIVTVEWFERNETKGKDLELDVILTLNQSLSIANSAVGKSDSSQPDNSAGNNSSSQQQSSQLPSKIQKYAPRATTVNWQSNNNINSGNISNKPSARNRQTNVFPAGSTNNDPTANNENQDQNSTNGQLPTTHQLPMTRSQARNLVSSESNGQVTSRLQQPNTSRRTNGQNVQIRQPDIHRSNRTAEPAMTDADDQDGLLDDGDIMTGPVSNVPLATMAPPQQLGNVQNRDNAMPPEYRRRSNVVKEVERLKKNREVRRAKQAETLMEKEAAKNMDTGNPNWDFLCMIRDYQDTLDYRPLTENDNLTDGPDHQICVCVRKRPISNKEMKRKEVDVITCPNKDQVIVHEPKTKVDLTKYLDNQHFRFDYAFDETSSNELVYKYTAKPLVLNIFDGGMATCFAYGQTGSGKTHTMGGEFHGKSQDSKNGIYAMATRDVFKLLSSPKYKGLRLQISCSYFEIYSGKVFDLLSGKSKLRVLEDGKQQVVIVGLTEKVVETVDDVLKLITHGNSIRTSGQTSANAHSSRSHAVFQILLRTSSNVPGARARGGLGALHGKLSLIDLAGNERGADTSSANRQTRMEGAEINKSLLALKECIRALGRKGCHLPFRASKLTQVLRDSFIGEKSKTCMIAMVSPIMASCEHTLNTLRYADRVKELGASDPANTARNAGPTSNMGGQGNMDGLSDGLHHSDDLMDDMAMDYDENGLLVCPEDSDLAQLRSMNEGELSADWFNFQEAISHLQMMEEELIENHHSVIKEIQEWIRHDTRLVGMTNAVDYDQDAYCQQLEAEVDHKIAVLSQLQQKARAFRQTLADEESKSQLLSKSAQQQDKRRK